MIRALNIVLYCCLILMLGGCIESLKTHKLKSEEENILARVGEVVLTKSDVADIYSSEDPIADSTLLLEAYVRSWVRRQVQIQEAERLVAGSGEDIEAMVNDYRKSLLKHRLEQYYVERSIDTVVTLDQMTDYYKKHKKDFKLDRTMVKGRIVRVPISYRQHAKLKTLMSSNKTEDEKDFIDLCVKNNFSYKEFDYWVDFREFNSHIPIIRGKSYDYMLPIRKIQELSDSEYKYYIEITGNLNKDDEAPLEHVVQVIRRIIYNQRRSEIIKRSEDSLYLASLRSGRAEMNIKIN